MTPGGDPSPDDDETGRDGGTGRLMLRFALLALLLVGSILLAVRLGAVSLSLREIVDGVAGRGDGGTVAIVRQLRLPRALQSALVGAALALSGATFQALVRNPLAEPYVLGVSSGAAVGAVGAIVLGLGAVWGVPLAAFVGALVAISLVFRIAYGVGAALDTHVLLLAGVVVGAFFNAAILLMLTLSDVESFRSAMFWMMGSNAGASWRSVLLLTAYVVPASLALLALARALNLLALGEQTAANLGTQVERTKLMAYALASMLAAVSVAVSGVIGFVGLVVPHVVRLLWGSDHRSSLPASALLGASFLVLTDLLARLAARPTELPIGVVTAFLGVPFFIWLLRRRARVRG
ncbi:MAG: FecCD family ABC transporter permease [Gemmatimonadaceae bacterium]